MAALSGSYQAAPVLFPGSSGLARAAAAAAAAAARGLCPRGDQERRGAAEGSRALWTGLEEVEDCSSKLLSGRGVPLGNKHRNAETAQTLSTLLGGGSTAELRCEA